jgi:hypothetical protein
MLATAISTKFATPPSSGTQCYQLAPGDYCTTCDLKNFGTAVMLGQTQERRRLLVLGKFIDDTGQTAQQSGNCVVAPANPGIVRAFVTTYNLTGTARHMIAGFDFRPRTARIEVSTNGIDLGKAKRFVAVAGLINDGYSTYFNPQFTGWITHLVSDAGTQRQACELVDDAVRYQLLGAK